MVSFTQLFAFAALAVAHTAATSCGPSVSFGTAFVSSDPATLESYGVEFTDRPCTNSYTSYQDLGIDFGDSYNWVQEASARAQVQYEVRETQVVAPVKSAPVVVKSKCDPSCLQLCLNTMSCAS